MESFSTEAALGVSMRALAAIVILLPRGRSAAAMVEMICRAFTVSCAQCILGDAARDIEADRAMTRATALKRVFMLAVTVVDMVENIFSQNYTKIMKLQS